jgi:hypothetical protein
MNRKILTILAIPALVACGQTAKTEGQGQPDIYNVEDSDEEMTTK